MHATVQPALQPCQEVVQFEAEGSAITDVLEGFADSLAGDAQAIPTGFLGQKVLGGKRQLLLAGMLTGHCVQACQGGLMPLAEPMPRALCTADNEPIVVRGQLAFPKFVHEQIEADCRIM